MKNVIDGISYWIYYVPKEIKRMSEIDVSKKPSPTKWSKKEILGHLCDSAIMNIERFIKIQYEKQPYVLPTYNQNEWVAKQNYQDTPIEEILTLFYVLNKQIIAIINNIPDEKRSYLCDIGNNELKTLEWLIQDYYDHMEHHLKKQIFK
ncbi:MULTISPECIES: DinB family protein [unclassified Viridibacillus]|uniref:DinB family protein n=1 Tax=unclassified Viridibacillus TaxID=2617942 RepID=UPI00096CD18D|nr:metal-dependent hydrolase [Viridibacillus sp. FSL H8-0123]OMC84269.1 metal-dependent hydrolase [Viridibacillus sp. FSL H7-0596]